MSIDYHFYEPSQGHGLPHDPFNAIIAPRPIGWTTLPPGRRQATGRDRARLKPQRRGGDPGCFHADRPMAAPREVP